MQRKPNTICFVCSKPIYRRPSQLSSNVYCSLACSGINQRSQKQCIICKKIYTGQKITCSRSCSNIKRGREGYKTQPIRDNAKRSLKLKKLLEGDKCIICNYNKYDVLVVHHIKPRCKGGTDEVSNLLLICPNCHGEIHQGLRDMEGRTLAC